MKGRNDERMKMEKGWIRRRKEGREADKEG